MLTLAFSVSEWFARVIYLYFNKYFHFLRAWGAKMFWLSNDLWWWSILYLSSILISLYQGSIRLHWKLRTFSSSFHMAYIGFLFWFGKGLMLALHIFFTFVSDCFGKLLSLSLIFIMKGWPMWIKISAVGEKCHTFQAKTNSCWCECLCTPLWLCTHSQGKLWLDLYD